MRKFVVPRFSSLPYFLSVLWSGTRCCSSISSSGNSGCSSNNGTASGPTIAPKKPKRRISTNIDASSLLDRVPRDPGAHAELSTAELERKLEEWSNMNPRQLQELYDRLEKQEEEESRVLTEDSLYQMDVSMRDRSRAAVRVFWKDVNVGPLDGHEGWYTVLVDGRKVKAFESTHVLAIPNEAMAYCCAQEYAEQSGYLNKLLMPMTDMCSGALTVSPQMIAPRVDYLMSFYQNDNIYFRAAPIAEEQDRVIGPIADWFSRAFNVEVPRIVGIGHPHIPIGSTLKVRDALLAMSMNPYQIVALCVAAQFTSSLLLPLAMFNSVVDLPTALSINSSEERHNTSTEGAIQGYHDIRDADVVTKLCACAVTWQLMKGISLSNCLEVARINVENEAL
ncbi:putative ATP12 chaperone protein [Trypanosoma cruzi]|nr:putative ATP12 chaperone protein [Trypanosoma cruzi]